MSVPMWRPASAQAAPPKPLLEAPKAQEGQQDEKRSLALVQEPQPYDPEAHGADCASCPCRGSLVVPPSPPTACEVPDAILVGQEPGAEELRQHRPFVGPSGRRVDKVLSKHGLKRERMWITNAALCLPKKDEDKPKATKCCAPRLRREIDQFSKSVPVVPMGALAFQGVYGRKMPITLVRGFQWMKDEREIYPTLHPAFVLRDHVQAPLFNRDFRRVATRIKQGFLELDSPKEYFVPTTVGELKTLLAKFGPRVAYDIETTEEPATVCTLLCIGLSDVNTTIVIHWDVRFKPLLQEFFRTHTMVGHNVFAFDSIVLERYGIVVPMKDGCVPLLEDTLIAHHVYASHMPQRLDHLVSFYLDMWPWKVKFGKRASDEKGKPKVPQDPEQLAEYNACDAYVTARVDQEMQADLAPWRELYEEDKELAALCREMQMNGVFVDRKLKEELSAAILVKEAQLYAEMKEINGGEDFSPKNPKDIRAILFEKFGAPVLERTGKKGLPSTNKKVLQAFASSVDRPWAGFAKKLITHRACGKMRVTYLDNLKIEADGRVRSGWRSFGTPTGRFASRAPNLTNLRRPENKEPEQRIREIYIAKPGHRLVGFDLEQVEPRAAAYVAGDPNMIKSVESGDYHTSNAIILFGPIPELTDPHEAKHGKGKNMRTLSKICGLAVNYGAGVDKIYETIRADGRFPVKYAQVVSMLSRLHDAYSKHFERVENDVEFCRKHGYIKIGKLSGRVRWLGHAPSPSDAANSPIQATAADIMNRLLIRIWKRLKKLYGTTVKLVAQIHDAGIFEVPEQHVQEVRRIIQEEADRPVIVNGYTAVFPIDLKDGPRWIDV